MEAEKTNVGGLPYSQRLRTPVLDIGDPDEKRIEIKEYFNQTYSLYEDLFSLLASDEAYYARADELRQPLIFYYGHTACFFINKLMAAKMWSTRVDPHIESICAVGVDELSWDDLNENNYDWPTVKALNEYRNQVRVVVNQVIDIVKLQLPISEEDPVWVWVILMGIEHERMHMETSSVLIRQLPIEMVRPRPNWPVCKESRDPPINPLLPVTGGTVRLGREDKKYYGWDNEFGTIEERVSDFEAAQYMVTNQEFLEFVESGGYEDAQWWTEEGWEWLKFQQATMPRFWNRSGDKYQLRCMAEMVDMPWDWPVEVNYFEAKAFYNKMAAKTRQPIRLPTEAEWIHLRNTECANQAQYPDWKQTPANIDLGHWASSCPVTLFQHGRFYDLIGNAWEWCESPIHPFPGFKPHPSYEDYTTPTFDGKHNVILSGSWISTRNEALRSFRNFYRRHFYQHGGFRYICSEQASASTASNYYETDSLLAQHLEFHFGKPYFQTDNYQATIVKHALEALGSDGTKNRAMDLGTAVGRTAFELAKHFDEVVGVDFSVRFIGSAVSLQQNGSICWQVVDEGDLNNFHEVSLQELDLTQENVDRVKFVQGDACNLKDNFKDFDLVVAANLIDRLYDPLQFLDSIQERIRPGGILAIISSAYSWTEEHTEKAKWLGGYRDERGEKVTTLQRLGQVLSAQFDLAREAMDVGFVVRETGRKFQHSVPQLTLWRKKRVTETNATN